MTARDIALAGWAAIAACVIALVVLDAILDVALMAVAP